MKKSIFLSLFIIFFILSNLYANPLKDEVIKFALSYENEIEIKNNRSERIDEIQKYFGLVGQPYCAMFVIYCYNKIYNKFKKENPLPKYPRVYNLYKYAISNPMRYNVYDNKILLLNNKKIQKGDLPIWLIYKKVSNNPNGHTGIVILEYQNNYLITIEGNTSPSKKITNINSEREGNGIFKKERSLIGNFRINYLIHIKDI